MRTDVLEKGEQLNRRLCALLVDTGNLSQTSLQVKHIIVIMGSRYGPAQREYKHSHWSIAWMSASHCADVRIETTSPELRLFRMAGSPVCFWSVSTTEIVLIPAASGGLSRHAICALLSIGSTLRKNTSTTSHCLTLSMLLWSIEDFSQTVCFNQSRILIGLCLSARLPSSF